MRILVTGGAGYLGSVLVRNLLKEGYYVRVLDKLIFGKESLLEISQNKKFQLIAGDIRDKKTLRSALDNIEAVVHLAALVGHPVCQAHPDEAVEINYKAVCSILEESVASGVSRFIFTSTCSNYGLSDSKVLACEDSELRPLSIYAENKVRAEKFILSFPEKKDFSHCILRLGTLFGFSSRMRFDLLINQLVKDALIEKKVVIQNPHAWRPYLHTQDAARIIIQCLSEPLERIHNEVFNVGCGNYQKSELTEIIKRYIPDMDVEISEKEQDRRDYKVSFEKIEKVLGFKASINAEQGVKEVKDAIEKGIFGDCNNLIYTNQNFNDE